MKHQIIRDIRGKFFEIRYTFNLYLSGMHQRGVEPFRGRCKTTHFGLEKNFKLPIFGAEGAENLKNRRFLENFSIFWEILGKSGPKMQ